MHAAAVGEDDVGVLHGGDEVKVVQRLAQGDALVLAQHTVREFLHIGVGVDGVEHLHLRVLRQDLQHGGEDVGQGLAKVLASVGGEQDGFCSAGLLRR